MKILMLNYEFPPLGGGAGNATFYLLKEFSQYKDLQIDLVTSSISEYKEEQFSNNIKIYFLDIGKRGNLHYQTNKNLISYAYKSYFFCKKLLKENTYHLCHAFFGIPCGFIATKLNLLYIVSLRGSDVPFYNPRFYWADRLVFKRLSRRIWKNSLRVIANSDSLRKLALESSPSQKIGVIYNGVDSDQFRPGPTKSDTLRILCISRLIKRKGVEYLIKAIGELRDSNIRLMIIGHGNREKELKGFVHSLGITQKVEFKSYLPHDKLTEIYQNSDAFVLPSLNEGMSNCALEAMACGLPVILTDTGGTRELLDGNGFIVDKKDHQAIARVLKKFLHDKELAVRMGRKSRSNAEQMSWHNAATAYHDIYKSLTLQ